MQGFKYCWSVVTAASVPPYSFDNMWFRWAWQVTLWAANGLEDLRIGVRFAGSHTDHLDFLWEVAHWITTDDWFPWQVPEYRLCKIWVVSFEVASNSSICLLGLAFVHGTLGFGAGMDERCNTKVEWHPSTGLHLLTEVKLVHLFVVCIMSIMLPFQSVWYSGLVGNIVGVWDSFQVNSSENVKLNPLAGETYCRQRSLGAT